MAASTSTASGASTGWWAERVVTRTIPPAERLIHRVASSKGNPRGGGRRLHRRRQSSLASVDCVVT
jgi:hypothetical protein